MKILDWLKLPETRGIKDLDDPATTLLHGRTLQLNGYEVISRHGLPAPFPLVVGDGPLARFLLLVNRALIKISKSIFSFQIALVAKPLPTLEHLLEDTFDARKQKVAAGSNET